MTADDDKTRNSPQKHVYEVDGAAFSSLEGFFDEVSHKLIPNAIRGKNLDAFNVRRKTASCCGGSIQMHLGNSSDSLRRGASCAVAFKLAIVRIATWAWSNSDKQSRDLGKQSSIGSSISSSFTVQAEPNRRMASNWNSTSLALSSGAMP